MKQCYGVTAKLREDCSGVPGRASIVVLRPRSFSLLSLTLALSLSPSPSPLSFSLTCRGCEAVCTGVTVTAEFQLRKTMPGDTTKTVRNNIAE